MDSFNSKISCISWNSKSPKGFILFSPPKIFGAIKDIISLIQPDLTAEVANLGPHSHKTLLHPLLASNLEINSGLSVDTFSTSTHCGILERNFSLAVEES